jgi:hypothetical protein
MNFFAKFFLLSRHLTNQPELNQESTLSTRRLLLGIWGHVSRRKRIQLGLLLVVMLASGGAEMVTLGAILPFLAVLTDPERLWQQPGAGACGPGGLQGGE